jgi:hypothetical protein
MATGVDETMDVIGGDESVLASLFAKKAAPVGGPLASRGKNLSAAAVQQAAGAAEEAAARQEAGASAVAVLQGATLSTEQYVAIKAKHFVGTVEWPVSKVKFVFTKLSLCLFPAFSTLHS